MLLSHLMEDAPLHIPGVQEDDVVGINKLPPPALLNAQIETASWLDSLEAPPETDTSYDSAKAAARDAFGAMVANVDTEDIKAKLMSLNTPPAVRHLVATLTAYDWSFVEQAKELRGYAVAQIMEHTKHPDAKVRLQALNMLGKVTEVALFTERVEVKKTEMSDSELDDRIRERMQRLTKFVSTSVTDVTPVEHAASAETGEKRA